MWTHYHLGDFRHMVSPVTTASTWQPGSMCRPWYILRSRPLPCSIWGTYGRAWEALQQEVADEAHVFGRAFQETGIGMYLLELGAYQQAATHLEEVITQAARLRHGWLGEWAGFSWCVRCARRNQQKSATTSAQALAAADENVLQGLMPWQAQALAVQAEVWLAEGRLEDALRQIGQGPLWRTTAIKPICRRLGNRRADSLAIAAAYRSGGCIR